MGRPMAGCLRAAPARRLPMEGSGSGSLRLPISSRAIPPGRVAACATIRRIHPSSRRQEVVMNRHARAKRLLPFLVVLALMAPAAAEQAKPKTSSKSATDADLANARPGRDPNQPIDEDYTKGIKKYTTETFFTSPLVDYLPASKTVPTPKAVLGDVAGAEGNLPYSKQVYEYMRLLAKSSPRVKVFTIGTSEEAVSYTHLRAHETRHDLVCRLLLEKKK